MTPVIRVGLVAALAVSAAACSDDTVCTLEQPLAVEPCALLGDACAPAGDAPPALTPHVQVVPSDAMPPEVESLLSHNNLDIAWHGDRLYFAFRTGVSHFASEDVVLYVVSTQDQVTWQFETKIELGTDVREPRFLSFDGRLFLYFAVLGEVPVLFEPQHAMVTEWQPCGWSEPERILPDLDGFIPWRTKVVDGVPYMMGYVGGENIYQPDGEPVRIYWLTTSDGRTFTPVIEDRPVVIEGGASETDWVIRDDGDLVAVARNELGDADTGWGSKICRAEAGDLGTWTCAADPRKYDSPILFRHGDEIYLIARRQVANDGNYDLMMRDRTAAEQYNAYNQAYWITPKRCALWRVDGDALTVEHVLDLPSAGDTCFPGVVPLEGGQYLVYNYTSPLDDPDLEWFNGQTGPTFIYRTTLSLP